MKKHYLLMALCTGILFAACSSENESNNISKDNTSENVQSITRTFAEPDTEAVDLSAMSSTNK